MSSATAPLPVSFVAKMTARTEAADELAQLLTNAVDLANNEVGTVVWFALRSDETTFWIFDAFPDLAARQTHASGPIVETIAANAERLLAAPPEINAADVLASKLP